MHLTPPQAGKQHVIVVLRISETYRIEEAEGHALALKRLTSEWTTEHVLYQGVVVGKNAELEFYEQNEKETKE